MENHGIYLLFLRRELVYVGRSKNPQARIETHRRNGRPFDFALPVPCRKEDAAWVEMALIKAFAPDHNRLGLTGKDGSYVIPPAPPAEIVHIHTHAREEPREDPNRVITSAVAEHMARDYGLLAAFRTGVRDGSVPFVWNGPSKAKRLFKVGEFGAWITRVTEARYRSSSAA